MNPTQAQLDARLNPTAFNINIPGEGQVFRAVGDNTGSTLYQIKNGVITNIGSGRMMTPNTDIRLPDGTILKAGVAIPLDDRMLRGEVGKPASSNFNGAWYSTTSVADVYNQKNGAGAYDALPTFNMGDIQSLPPSAFKAQPSMKTLNDTPNALATPEQIAAQMKDPNWVSPSFNNLVDATSSSKSPVAYETSGANPMSALGITYPIGNLQPGQTGDQVKQLQQFLVANGYMTQAQMDTGPGTYGPKTTAAVAAWQKANNVDTAGNPGYWGPRSIAAANTATTSGGAGAGTGGTTGTTNTSGYKPTGDSAFDAAFKNIQGLVDSITSNGFTIPTNLQITPDLVSTFLNWAHQAVDPQTQQLLSAKVADINAGLKNVSLNYQNQVGELAQGFGTTLATNDNAAGGAGTAFSGQRNLNNLNLVNSTNRSFSTLANNAAYSTGGLLREGAAALGADNAGGLNLPTIATGNVSLGGGQRGAFGFGGNADLGYNPSLYTAGTIPTSQYGALNNLQGNYLSQYGTLAGNNSRTAKGPGDIIKLMTGLPQGYQLPANLT